MKTLSKVPNYPIWWLYNNFLIHIQTINTTMKIKDSFYAPKRKDNLLLSHKLKM